MSTYWYILVYIKIYALRDALYCKISIKKNHIKISDQCGTGAVDDEEDQFKREKMRELLDRQFTERRYTFFV